MFRAEPPPQKQRPAPSALLETCFRNMKFYKPNKVFQLLGRGLVCLGGSPGRGEGKGLALRLGVSGLDHPQDADSHLSGPLQERRWPAQGGAADTGRERVQPPPPARGGGPVHPLHIQKAQPRHLKGPGPQSARSTAGLCSGPKHGPPLASAGMRARPHSKLTPPGTNTPSGRGCRGGTQRAAPPCSAHPDMGGVILTPNLVTHDLSLTPVWSEAGRALDAGSC